MKKYVIIHGHFYQPPRENPWIDTIETQESAAPYHDWNERVHDECYRPNAYSRLLDANGAIIDIHNNYRTMNFNFGPTLFSWLEQRHIGTVRRIVEADRSSAEALEGHGNAIAQVYNHVIMPLASRRDQLTQIRWARHYFRERFKREPEGMWLAETAINMETVTCLIEENIRFVILSPAQAEAFRPLDGNAQWTPAGSGLDTRQAYRIYPSDRAGNRIPGFLDVFFFDAALSREAGFGDLLKDAHVLGNRINASFDGNASTDQAVILATDGETFGHHKPFGDMCLAYFFKKIAPRLNIVPVNFGYFLAKNPPRREVSLKDAFGEGTSWSCVHGVGRWARDCGCATGGEPKWKQGWRAPLRAALQQLQVSVDREYESVISAERLAPWELRDAYIQVIDDPSLQKFIRFLDERSGGLKFTRERAMAIRKLLEAQKYILYAFTSCGWFFSDIGGLEAVQNLAYGIRALQLGIGVDVRREQLLQEFTAVLDQAKSNVPGATGRTLVERKILPFLAHEKIVAFTAAVEKTISFIGSDKIRLFHIDTGLRQLCAVKSGHLSYHGFEVSLENLLNGEQSRWAVLVSHRAMAEVRGWVVAADAFGKKLSSSIEPTVWMQHTAAQSFTLMDIFQTSRETMAEYIHQNIFKDTYSKYSAWMQKNEQELDFLSRLNFPLPLYCMAPLSFVYQQQWNHLVRQLEQRGDEVRIAEKLHDLSGMGQQFKITFDLKESAALLERIVVMELSILSARLSAETCARIECLLNIIDRFKVPVSKNKMEDAFAPIITGPVQALRDEIVRTIAAPGGAVGRERVLLLTLVKFAHRMNFNTDALSVP
ncbi:MAG: DUF3536 domain-containing protein [Chitinispirillaceae bacterium]|jgi:hypothetical protein